MYFLIRDRELVPPFPLKYTTYFRIMEVLEMAEPYAPAEQKFNYEKPINLIEK